MSCFFEVVRQFYIFAQLDEVVSWKTRIIPYDWENVLKDIVFAKRHLIMVRWVSGLNQQFAKLPYSIRVPGVRIPPSPQPNKNHAERRGFVLSGTVKNLFYKVIESTKTNHEVI